MPIINGEDSADDKRELIEDWQIGRVGFGGVVPQEDEHFQQNFNYPVENWRGHMQEVPAFRGDKGAIERGGDENTRGFDEFERGRTDRQEASNSSVFDDVKYFLSELFVGSGTAEAGFKVPSSVLKPFYSTVERAIEGATLKAAPAEQWIGTLKNTPGVKQEELDWVLSDLPGGKLTKEQVQEHFAANQVEVQEVVKGGNPVIPVGDNGRPLPKFAYDDTKFSQYQLPGGENYRELLLTLPGNKADAFEGQMRAKYGSDYTEHLTPQEYDEFTRLANAGEAMTTFRSSHYDEPNVLAHVRFNDRVDAQGKKTLFIEEIQSDWHQKGRKQGYGVQKGKAEQFSDGSGWGVRDTDGLLIGHYLTREAAEAAASRLQPVTGRGVPDAPFKTSWPELALKRMIKWAADNGYDAISWTPGKVQAERYDLSTQIDGLEIIDYKNGTYEVMAKAKGEKEYRTLATDIPKEKLPDYVGKELAEKALGEMKKQKDGYNDFVHYEGLDLQVGGEGMVAFYDKMLVNTANKLGKKYGAKVGVGRIKTGEGGKYGPLRVASDGNRYWLASDTHGKVSDYFKTPEAAMDAREEMLKADAEVWTLPITDALKKAAMTGFPLFTALLGIMGDTNEAEAAPRLPVKKITKAANKRKRKRKSPSKSRAKK